MKEIHYFDRSAKYPSTNVLEQENLFTRVISRDKSCKLWRRQLARDFGGALLGLDRERLKWCTRFYLSHISDEWYQNLFRFRDEPVIGEITPAYSMLKESDVLLVKKMLPDVRVIYLIRDPIERAWSHVRFDAQSGKIKNINDLNEVKKYIDSPVVASRGDYLSTVKIWKSVFSDQQFFLGFYDTVKADPEAFLLDLSSFLGIDAELFPLQNISRNVGVSPQAKMPEEVLEFLIEKYEHNLGEMAELFGGPAEQWVGRYRNFEQ